MSLKIAVVGAGLAGLSCASTLRRAGHFVEVFEQDRIIGGRAPTVRVGALTFDAGAQYLTARSATFRRYIDELVSAGYAARWEPRMSAGVGEKQAVQLHAWYVGTPGMSSIVRPLTEGVRVHTGRKVHTLQPSPKGWTVVFDDETSTGPYSAVAVAVPAAQARNLLGKVEGLSEVIGRARMAPAWSLMMHFNEQVLPDQDVFSDMSDVVRWIARNSSKPQRRGKGDSIVVHASPDWSREAVDLEPADAAEELWSEVAKLFGLDHARPDAMTAQLWQHGIVEQSLGETYVYSSHYRVGAAGDWCLGRLAEHAFESGHGLAKAIIHSFG